MKYDIDELRHAINKQLSSNYMWETPGNLYGGEEMMINAWEIFHNYKIYSISGEFPKTGNISNNWISYPTPDEITRHIKKQKASKQHNLTV